MRRTGSLNVKCAAARPWIPSTPLITHQSVTRYCDALVVESVIFGNAVGRADGPSSAGGQCGASTLPIP